MKNILSITICAIALFLSPSSLVAQENRNRNWEDRMKAEKIAFLTDAMDLTSSEAERFWPVYNRCEAEKREAWKQIFDSYRALENGIKSGKEDKEIATLMDKYFKAQKAGDNIDEKYVAEYRKILPNKKIAKLFIGEENFRRLQIHRLNRNDNSKNDKK